MSGVGRSQATPWSACYNQLEWSPEVVCCNKNPPQTSSNQILRLNSKAVGVIFSFGNKLGLPNKLWLVNFYCGPAGQIYRRDSGNGLQTDCDSSFQ